MTWLVKVALERPYTFIVMALMILIFGPLAAIRTPTDIFPNIGIPVIGVAFTYSGLSPDEMGARIWRAMSASSPPPSTMSSMSKASPCRASASSRSSSSPMSISAWPRPRSPRSPRPPSARCRSGTQPPADPQLQRLHRAGAADGLFLHLAVGTAGAGLFAELRPPPPDHGAGRGGALFLWRQVPLGADRPGSPGDAGARPVGHRCAERLRQPEPDHAGRQHQDRQLPVCRAAQQCRRHHRSA